MKMNLAHSNIYNIMRNTTLMKIRALLVIGLMSIFGCAKKQDNIAIEKAKQDSLWRVGIQEIALKYNAWGGIDTLDYVLTYDYQKKLEFTSNILLTSRWDINDLIKINSGYEIWIDDYSMDLSFKLTGNENQVKQLISSISKRTGWGGLDIPSGYVLVAKISSVKKVRFGIETEVELDEDSKEDAHVYMDIGHSNKFIFKGELLAIEKIEL